MTNWMIPLVAASMFMSSTVAHAGKPPVTGGGGSGGKTPPDPDIVYLSDDNSTEALSQAAVRGLELARNRDVSLLKSRAGRSYATVTWSPDGTFMAWIELGLGMASTPHYIVVAAPGSKPTAIYTSTPGDGNPQLATGTDMLAWGRVECPGVSGTKSILVFESQQPAGIYGIELAGGQSPAAPFKLMAWSAAATGWAVPPGKFAFSPRGQYLAFAGSYGDSGYGVWALPMCGAFPAVPSLVVEGSSIGGREPEPVTSMDWSRKGDRLALSVTTGTDLPWRDLMIASLNYSYSNQTEQLQPSAGVCRVDLEGDLGSASSEHSPQWGPDDTAIAFSQSSDLGRAMFLLTLGSGSCSAQSLAPLPSRWPRALDWK